jgi:amino acid adenylation domain-containing protein
MDIAWETLNHGATLRHALGGKSLSGSMGSPLTSRPVPEQLLASAERWPDRRLYASASGNLTYGECCQSMLKIAAWLGQIHALEPGHRVAICLPTNPVAIPVILGVLAAGASYMPVPFSGPAERRAAILAGFDPRLIITTEAIARKLTALSGGAPTPRLAVIESSDNWLAAVRDAVAPLPRPVAIDPEGLAAVYFTSGSTGEPKGVMFSHRGMAAAVAGMMAMAELNSDDRMISLAGLHYVASMKLFNPIAEGCQCYVATDGEAMFAERLSEIMEQQRTTIWHATASQFRQLVESGRLETRDLTSLRGVRFVGDRAPVSFLRRAMDLLPRAAFQNRYGASEAIGMLYYELPRPLPDGLDDLPLGKPIGGFALSLRDEAGEEVAPGEIGEICAVGPGVLMGYWKRPDLTAAARFGGDPSSYRTGDLAYIGPDGDYRLVGRRDHQVKIRGHRFELGEIEAVLKSHPEVRDAVAFVVGDDWGGEEVRACLLASPVGPLIAEVTAACLHRLPVFARPVRFAVMDQFPRLSSGKVDRMALQKRGAGEGPI